MWGDRSAQFVHPTHQVDDVRRLGQRKMLDQLVAPAGSKTKGRNEINNAVSSGHLVEAAGLSRDRS
jgi:hypothetical protein